ncbi:hypothetical protein QRD02_09810 [Aequorivita sp. SDUM287046]|uniref:Anti-sigma factor n=1 Tax=Aequorivita aurantiaca TaxID=3053356 RepID=A0ABT8DH02_9FLAO|nr:hypothetical protein [Aequorivita aurantiaca]MDN3724680.1 hypothetical protein [Aequorivita aurantiaca]
MARDIKKMFENYTPEPVELPKGHEARFKAKLNQAFPETSTEKRRTSWQWLKIASVAVVLIAVSFFGYQQLSPKNSENISDTKNSVVDIQSEKVNNSQKQQLTLADISPDLKKMEEYYMTGINVQLASLKITEENRDVVNGYMQRLAELDKEYNRLNLELNKVGPTEATVVALIDNLKIRLDLLFKLKNKLKELKNQNNENFEIIQT